MLQVIGKGHNHPLGKKTLARNISESDPSLCDGVETLQRQMDTMDKPEYDALIASLKKLRLCGNGVSSRIECSSKVARMLTVNSTPQLDTSF